jgi:hypothetical protein
VADTAEGRALTLRHRVQQARVGAAAAGDALAAWTLLDLARLDDTSPAWLAITLSRVRQRYALSQSLAARYLDQYARVEIGSPGPVAAPPLDERALVTDLQIRGPIAVKMLVSRGVDADEAFALARRTVAGRASVAALAGGRRSIRDTVGVDPRARTYRRVSDGRPCAFCAMLVARSITMGGFSDPGFRAHPHCGCTAELVYEGQEAPERDQEAEWIAAYDQAAKQARAAGEPVVAPSGRRRRDTVLWRMRRNRPDLFSDGHAH